MPAAASDPPDPRRDPRLSIPFRSRRRPTHFSLLFPSLFSHKAVKYIDSAAIAAKGEADGAKMAAMLEKKAAKSLARGEADAGKYAKKLVTGESDKADCDKKAAGEAVSFTVTTTVTKEAKEGKVR